MGPAPRLARVLESQFYWGLHEPPCARQPEQRRVDCAPARNPLIDEHCLADRERGASGSASVVVGRPKTVRAKSVARLRAREAESLRGSRPRKHSHCLRTHISTKFRCHAECLEQQPLRRRTECTEKRSLRVPDQGATCADLIECRYSLMFSPFFPEASGLPLGSSSGDWATRRLL